MLKKISKWTAGAVLASLLVLTGSCSSPTSSKSVEASPSPTPVSVVAATPTPKPAATATPTPTPAATATPGPTATPAPVGPSGFYNSVISLTNGTISNGTFTVAPNTTVVASGCTDSLMLSGTSAPNPYGPDTNIDERFTLASPVNLSTSTGVSLKVYVPAGSPVQSVFLMFMSAAYGSQASASVQIGDNSLTPGSWNTITIPTASLSSATAVTFVDVFFQTGFGPAGTSNTGPAGVSCTGYIDALQW